MAVKSALRVLQILEHFDEMQSGLNAQQIAESLKWPRSSTWGILKTLAEAGYLSFDAKSKRYLPTERVAVLGLWAHPLLIGEGRLLHLMKDLQARTGGRVVLAAQAGNLVRYIHTVYSGRTKDWHFRKGVPIEILKTSVGRLFLSLKPDHEIRRFIYHINTIAPNAADQVDIEATLREIDVIRRQGYSVAVDKLGSGRGTISLLLPKETMQSSLLALGVTLTKDEISHRQEGFLTLLQGAIAKHFPM